MQKKLVDSPPLIYEAAVSVRFSDFDFYGHVNASRYLDFVSCSRWSFLYERFQVGPEYFYQENLGFYVLNSSIQFKKAITRLGNIWVTSFTEEQSFSTMGVAFSITSSEKDVEYASGNFRFAIMDLDKQKPKKLPIWAQKYFYHLD